ncbi:zinc ABC transporter substrate-binding protein ZnuA [Alkalilimnicola ehrlichii]|nr:zinc ABC transporter substrate-binding protein ZnuA [Alkalilimnicola ehrlichii]
MYRYLIFLLLLVPGLSAYASAPQVVVSIQPVHSLVAGITDGVTEPRLLLHGGASPHTYNLRPSDARNLQQADLVVWVGPELEAFMERTLRGLAQDAQVVTLTRQTELTLLPTRTGGNWDEDDHHHHGHHHHHGNGDIDAHLWLDPHNAKAIVAIVSERLQAIDPANADTYRQNADALQQRLDTLDEEIQSTLAPVRERPFIVFHDAYQYLEQRYDLNAVGSVTVSPEQHPGARRITQLRNRIQSLGADCIFREPQFEPTMIQALIRGTDVRVGVLDPLGADIPPGPDAYFLLLSAAAQAITECLD